MIDPEAPVNDPAEFVGQHRLIRRVLSRIGAERPQSVAVIGGLKSGKSLLISYLSAPEVAYQHLDAIDKYVFLSFRANREMTDKPDSFLDHLSKGLPSGTAGGENYYEEFHKRIESLHLSGQRLIVFLDDFHFITSNDHFQLEFFSFLRSMANNYNLAYVTTSLLELQKLCVAKEIQESPFFNIFTNMHIGMLSHEDAVTLFKQVTGAGDNLAERVVKWCGRSPYLLKKTGALLATEKAPDTFTDKEFEKIFFPVVATYFEHVVSFLSPEAFKPLQAVTRGKAPSPLKEYQLSTLVKQGFLIKGEDGISCFSPAFALFLRKCLSPKLLKGRY